jgi:hypothetical protein
MSLIFSKLGLTNADWVKQTDEDYNQIVWKDGVKCTKEEWDTAKAELKAEYDANEYARNRASEYPSLLELTVALYDTDDKSAVEAKRAAVKLKYPKPS